MEPKSNPYIGLLLPNKYLLGQTLKHLYCKTLILWWSNMLSLQHPDAKLQKLTYNDNCSSSRMKLITMILTRSTLARRDQVGVLRGGACWFGGVLGWDSRGCWQKWGRWLCGRRWLGWMEVIKAADDDVRLDWTVKAPDAHFNFLIDDIMYICM